MKNTFTYSLTFMLLLCALNANAQISPLSKQNMKEFKKSLEFESNDKMQEVFQAFPGHYQKSVGSVDDFGSTPALNWAGDFGGSGSDQAYDIAYDNDGNVFISGTFSGEITIADQSLTSSGSYDAIVAKFDAQGNIDWIKQFPSGQNERSSFYGISLDMEGNVFVTGYHTGSANFGGISLEKNADYNLLFAKLSGSGEVLLARNHGIADETGIGRKVGTDVYGNIYIIGSASTSISSRTPSVFLKYDNTGNLLWEKYYDEGLSDFYIVESGIYLAGVNMGNDEGYLDPNVILGYPTGYHDVFIAKTDLDGNFLWGEMLGHESGGDSMDPVIHVDENENIIFSGFFRSDLMFGSDVLYASVGLFTAKYNTEFNVFEWSASYPVNASPLDIESDNNGDVYVVFSDRVLKYSSSGYLQVDEQLEFFPRSMIVDNGGRLLLCGRTDGFINVAQKDLSLNTAWNVRADGNTASAELISLVTDNSGNVYVYGNLYNDQQFAGQDVEDGLFLSKHDGSGRLVWLKNFPDISVDYGSQGNYMNIDNSTKHLYITGVLNEDLIIPGETTLHPDENGSFFILKYDLNGTLIKAIKEDAKVEEPSVVPDFLGNIIVTGTFFGNINLGGTYLNSTDGSRDGFIAKYDASGAMVWVKQVGGNDTEWMVITATDVQGNIYISGEFYSELVAIGDDEFIMNEGDGNIFFAKMDPNGNVSGSKTLARSSIGSGDYNCWPTGIITNPEGDIYLKGWHGDSVYFDDIMLRSTLGPYSYFIAKLDNAGNVLWANSINEATYGFDYNQFDYDLEGNVYLGAQARDTIQFGDDFRYVNSGANDLFVAKYMKNGILSWVKTLPSEGTGYNWVSSVAVHRNDNVFVGGFFMNNLTLGNQELTGTNRHGFISMFGPDIVNPGSEVYNKDWLKFEVYPNPSKGLLNVRTESNLEGDFVILNNAGQVVHQEQILSENQLIDVSGLPEGIYFLKINGNKLFKAEKIMIE